jgi:predicted transcriptional regulator
MSTTSLKLSDELKQRAVAAAAKQGMSPHAFMVHAIDQAATSAEQRARFVSDALAARDEAVRTDRGYDADQAHAYLKARAAGKRVVVPKPVSWRG